PIIPVKSPIRKITWWPRSWNCRILLSRTVWPRCRSGAVGSKPALTRSGRPSLSRASSSSRLRISSLPRAISSMAAESGVEGADACGWVTWIARRRPERDRDQGKDVKVPLKRAVENTRRFNELTHVLRMTMVPRRRIRHTRGTRPMTDSHHDAVRRDNLERARANEAQSANPLPLPFNGRWTRRHWAHASLFATIGALLAAIVPGFPAATQGGAAIQRITLALTLPQIGPRDDSGADRWQSVTLRSGQTLSGVFDELGIPYSQLQKVMQHPRIKPALRKLRPGTALSFNLPADGSVRAMRIEANPALGDEPVELQIDGDAVRERALPKEVSTRTVALTGKVGQSLFASARKLGLGNAQLNQLTGEMFKYDIDFGSDLDPDDRFSVVVDQTWRNGQLVKTGPVLAATFTVDHKLKSAFRFMRNGK